MIRECATAGMDLPHAYRLRSDDLCWCERAEHDPLHEVAVVEKAELSARFVTEKGTPACELPDRDEGTR